MYKVKTVRSGLRRVVFACPFCNTDLESPIEEAGDRFACPNCGRESVTPGKPELEKWRQAQHDAESAKIEQERRRQEKLDDDRKAREAAEVEQRRLRAEKLARKNARAASPQQ